MRKTLIDGVRHNAAANIPDRQWLALEQLAAVELTSEDGAHPIEAALEQEATGGWRAAAPGPQRIRLLFATPLHMRAVQLGFVETQVARTQEYCLRWSADGGKTFHEIVRQQWNFSPLGETNETETHEVDLFGVNVLELEIRPDIGNHECVASLHRLRIA